MPTKIAQRWLIGVVICLLPTLFYYYVGEEGVFTLNAVEMAQSGVWRDTVMYGVRGGGGNGRPPLHAWLLIPLAQTLGWAHVLLASRLIAILSTLATAATLGWLAHVLWPRRQMGWSTALLYLLTVDVLFYRGWLAYADPLFACLTVLALALCWAACARRQLGLLLLAWAAACGAMLAKALVVYGVLGVAATVLATQAPYRRFLLQPRAWAVHAAGLALPLIWLLLIAGDSGQHGALLHDLVRYFEPAQVSDYLARFVTYPLEMAARLLPASGILLWAWWQRRRARRAAGPRARPAPCRPAGR